MYRPTSRRNLESLSVTANSGMERDGLGRTTPRATEGISRRRDEGKHNARCCCRFGILPMSVPNPVGDELGPRSGTGRSRAGTPIASTMTDRPGAPGIISSRPSTSTRDEPSIFVRVQEALRKGCGAGYLVKIGFLIPPDPQVQGRTDDAFHHVPTRGSIPIARLGLRLGENRHPPRLRRSRARA
jgi:hypothetical protein